MSDQQAPLSDERLAEIRERQKETFRGPSSWFPYVAYRLIRDDVPDLLTEIARLKGVERARDSEIKRLLEAVKEYGDHKLACRIFAISYDPADERCTCGLRAAVTGEEAT